MIFPFAGLSMTAEYRKESEKMRPWGAVFKITTIKVTEAVPDFAMKSKLVFNVLCLKFHLEMLEVSDIPAVLKQLVANYELLMNFTSLTVIIL